MPITSGGSTIGTSMMASITDLPRNSVRASRYPSGTATQIARIVVIVQVSRLRRIAERMSGSDRVARIWSGFA